MKKNLYLLVFTLSVNYANAQYAITRLGDGALLHNTRGNYNTGLGYFSLTTNISGNYNTATGAGSLLGNTYGNNNTANGFNAMFYNSTGSYNTVNGSEALYSNTTSSYNTANGVQALYSNTMGFYNTAIGYGSLYSNMNGGNNVAGGAYSLRSNRSGFNNVAIGDHSLFSHTNGNGNVALGTYALYEDLTGNNNIAVGYDATVGSDNLSNAIAIGYTALVDASNKAVIGNTSMRSIGGYVNWTVYPSDGRYKQNIKENVPGLAFINKLRPVTYNVDIDAIEVAIKPQAKRNNNEKISDDEIKAISEKKKVVFTGFVAQEVKKAAKDVSYDFSGIDTTGSIWGLRYAEFVVPLVKAVQELSRKNDSLQSRLDNLEQHLGKQQTTITNASRNPVAMLSSAYLQQNNPNPFASRTSIHYYIPAGVSNAQIIVTDGAGKTLKQLSLHTTGEGDINIDASTLSNGSYNYSLLIKGKLIDSKKMVVAR